MSMRRRRRRRTRRRAREVVFRGMQRAIRDVVCVVVGRDVCVVVFVLPRLT